MSKLKRMINYYKAHGLKAVFKKVKKKWFEYKGVKYTAWLKNHAVSVVALEKQRNTRFVYEPKISIVVPLYQTPKKYLIEMIESVINQTYSNWELCLSDGDENKSCLDEVLSEIADSRIKVIKSKEPLHIAENTNQAMQIASGDYIAFMDHDDVLSLDALFEYVSKLKEDPSLELLYSDEDKVDMEGKEYFEPHFKPDFNLDLLRSMNYICHLLVVKKTLCTQVGQLDSLYNGAQDYDYLLRCVEKTTNIAHIPKVLYHWRAHRDSTAECPESKLYAFEAGMAALRDHYKRCGYTVTVEQGPYLGTYHTGFLLEKEPLISIIIPNKDHVDDLEQCIESLEIQSSYSNVEYIIVENNSTQQETFAYYKELQKMGHKVKIVFYKGNFNYSKINNMGVQESNGEYLLLLNNDVKIKHKDSVREMLSYCMQEDVGCVGAKLLYPDATLQHGGVIVGAGGIAGHCFVGLEENAPGYFSRAVCVQNYSAVTAACMMTKKSVYWEVGGLREEFEVAFNDIDYCLKVGAKEKRVVYNPYAQFYHFESKSRGMDNAPEKAARFAREIALFETLWPEILDQGDAHYNPNLSYHKANFQLGM